MCKIVEITRAANFLVQIDSEIKYLYNAINNFLILKFNLRIDWQANQPNFNGIEKPTWLNTARDSWLTSTVPTGP